MAGAGPLRYDCERFVREAGMEEHVRFAGIVPHADVPVLMAAADVFVSTSTLSNRALPTCEAMICGVPVLAYDTGDTATIVRDGVTGVLVRDGNRKQLAPAMAKLLVDAGLRARLADAARQLAREAFVSWESRIAMELEIIKQVARKQNGRPVHRPPVSS
jgi:glycosyltransferase involved in cell wall biosynthesis